MKANKLMIGDFLRYKEDFPSAHLRGRIVKVCGIRGRVDVRTVEDDKFHESEHPDWLEPIPLTPEILEKNGFVANEHVYPYPYYEYINEKDKLKVGLAFPQGNRTSYKEPWVYIDSEYVFVEHLPCIYVHQLQHALRMCGIDKEVEL